ncbi:MAG: Rrf2 family transcriptional regulator [Peptococcaceae bacterium]|nr:Rrf2 family transcriptional regulator [Peptococcaceae bacterium]MBQ3509132.1 Rrf2 family transcriptional regulator [Peptococcaceae bacterium]
MKISTKGRYALRLMLDLAQYGMEQDYVSIKKVSQRQDISEKYLEQIVAQLSRSGFVNSARGAQGGYCLARSPQEYTVGMILRQIEGNLSTVSCLEESPNKCRRCNNCVTLEVWQQINDAVNSVIDNITLQDLLEKQLAQSNAIEDEGNWTPHRQ